MFHSIEVAHARNKGEDWDRFAAACGASFRCARRALSLWQFDHHLLHRVKRLELFARVEGERRKIGQCALGLGRRRRVFADSLQLLPEHRGLWGEAMQAVLRHLGPGEYHYGSQWNLEAPREEALGLLPGVRVLKVEAITLDVVEFRQWPSWESYFRAISNNAKRNAKRAQEQFEQIELQTRSGAAALRSWRSFHALKSMLAQRKKLGLSSAKSLLRFAMRTAALGGGNFTALLRCEGQPAAGFAGIDFGDNTYFLEAGSRDSNNGAAWHLLLSMLARAYARQPRGCFVMGAQYARDARDEGLAFSRRQVRVTLMPTSEVTFLYQPARAEVLPLARIVTPLRQQAEELAVAAHAGSEMPRGA